jgi:hypothetical protein
MMGNKPSVGGVHRKGALIRRNLRRYCTAPPDEILTFLKLLDVLKDDFGSSACTKTKDEAMSINTHPAHPIGKKMLDAVQSAIFLFKFRSGGTQPAG